MERPVWKERDSLLNEQMSSLACAVKYALEGNVPGLAFFTNDCTATLAQVVGCTDGNYRLTAKQAMRDWKLPPFSDKDPLPRQDILHSIVCIFVSGMGFKGNPPLGGLQGCILHTGNSYGLSVLTWSRLGQSARNRPLACIPKCRCFYPTVQMHHMHCCCYLALFATGVTPFTPPHHLVEKLCQALYAHA